MRDLVKMDIPKKRLQLFLALIIVIAFLTRFLILVSIEKDPGKFYTFDSDDYMIPANNLKTHGVFSGEMQPPFTPYTYRTPIYPLFLAINLSIFGANLSQTILMQVILGSLTVLFTFLLTKRLMFSDGAALIAASIVAIDPVSILLSNQLLTETLFTFELVTGILLFSMFWQKEQAWMLIASAVMISLAVLTRPIAQYLPIALFFLFAFSLRKKVFRTVIFNGLIFILISGLIMGFWAYRNYRASDIFTLSTISDENLLFYKARAVLAEAENISQDGALIKLEAEIRETTIQKNLSLSEINSLERSRAVQIFFQYPLQTTALMIKGAIILLIDPGFTIMCSVLDPSNTSHECISGQASMLDSGIINKTVNVFQEMNMVQKILLTLSLLLLGLMYIGILIGVTNLVRNRNWFTITLLIGLIAYFILLSAGVSNYRFRAPIIPFLAILAGIGYGSIQMRRS